jgi:hypothetical protein
MADETKDAATDPLEETEAVTEETSETKVEEKNTAEESSATTEAGKDGDGHDEVTFSPPGDGPVDGMAAFFVHPNEILDAAEKARDKSLEKWDVFTPFPIHGMDDAMGIGTSWIPWVTFGAAMVGMTTALSLQTGTMFIDWQINIGGKPFLPWPSFMPITFELSVLFAGITTAVVMFLACGLPNLKPKVIDSSITRDRFVLWIDANDPSFDRAKTREFLESLDPVEVREVRFDS